MTQRRARGWARPLAAVLVLSLLPILGGCASTKERRNWSSGDAIICPHCGREFPVPEKLGP